MRRVVTIAVAALLSLAAVAQTSGTVRDGMEAVSERYGVYFAYDSNLPVDTCFKGQDFRGKSLQASLKTLFAGTGIEWRVKGRYILLTAPAPADPLEAFAVIGEPGTQMDTIAAATVTGKIDRNLNLTQTGLTRLDGRDLNSGFAVFGTPDIIKTLQLLPGVASGTELMSGLFVHGGTGGDNLFLLDGSSVYNTSHLIGLFSSLNSDVVEDVDFYKSGFPARYGGRLSSVVDVSTRDGDLFEYHGSLSLGLIDGRLQLEGPLVKGRTSFLFGLRRTWMDVITIPAIAFVNNRNSNREKTHGNYSFWDLNLGLTHHLDNGDVLRVRVFNGMDHLKGGQKQLEISFDPSRIVQNSGYSDYDAALNWGSTTAGLIWNHDFSSNLVSKIGMYYSYNVSSLRYGDRMWRWDDGNYYTCSDETDRSSIHGIRAAADFDWEPSHAHHIRFGASWEHHAYNPERALHQWDETPKSKEELSSFDSGTSYSGEEPSIYVEDEMTVYPGLTANLGIRSVLFLVEGNVYVLPEPRAALRFDVSDAVALKASYTWMNQFEHKLQTTYVDLPTYLWLPTTASMRPMHSQQAAAGIYTHLPHGLHLDIEGFWKTMDHIYEYSGPSALYPPVDRWETAFTEGRGRAYGAEVAFGWENEKTSVDVVYTLSWSERFFAEFSDRWYPDRNDNRHKFNITATHKFSERFEVYGGWVYHSGNRMTLGTQGRYQGTIAYSNGSLFTFYSRVFTGPNNIKLPDYHRLDIGMNFIKQKLDGKVRTWNLSLYNAYCRLNTVYADVQYTNGKNKGRSYGLIPIIPTFSYSLRF